MPHPRIRRHHPETQPDPITTAKTNTLRSDTKWRYQLWANQQERLDEEIRLIMCGQRPNLKRLQRIQQERDLRYEALLHYLHETARRRSLTDDRPYDDTAEYLTTAAQKIAKTATQQPATRNH